MKTLLFISCSPRGEQSNSYQLAEHFIHSVTGNNSESWRVKTLDLWAQSLPAMDMTASSAKYAIMSGNELNDAEQRSWDGIKQHFSVFNDADAIVIALPMWNFGIPYVLKHYIDVITQPGLCFTWDPATGYTPLVEPKRCVLVSSSAGDYSAGSGHEDDDFCVSYLQRWLAVYFGYQVDHLSFAPTVATAEALDVVSHTVFEQADALAEQFYSLC